MGKRTAVYDYHKDHGNIVDYAGYELPVWFEGIIAECRAVRSHAGLFDVSHMGRIIVQGEDSEVFLEKLVTNDVSSLRIDHGQYTILCNPAGGIIDDLTIFRLGKSKFLVVYNAANRDKNWNWLMKYVRANDRVKLSDLSDDSSMFAVQGPRAAALLRRVSGIRLEEVEKYSSTKGTIDKIPFDLTRSGYTGEDGFEIYLWHTSMKNPKDALYVWNKLLSEGRQFGLRPAGLGARDVLRLEAGMCLYGNDIDEKTTPVEARLNFVVRLEKKQRFVGQDVLEKQREAGPPIVRIGFKILGKGIPRQGQVFTSNDQTIGNVTSGTFSPTLNVGIGMGYVKPGLAKYGERLDVQIRDHNVPAEVVKLPFYQRKTEEKLLVFGQEMGLKDFRTQHVMKS
jgi:aminomethyltransferase